jgi:hypothetical protein
LRKKEIPEENNEEFLPGKNAAVSTEFDNENTARFAKGMQTALI